MLFVYKNPKTKKYLGGGRGGNPYINRYYYETDDLYLAIKYSHSYIPDRKRTVDIDGILVEFITTSYNYEKNKKLRKLKLERLYEKTQH